MGSLSESQKQMGVENGAEHKALSPQRPSSLPPPAMTGTHGLLRENSPNSEVALATFSLAFLTPTSRDFRTLVHSRVFGYFLPFESQKTLESFVSPTPDSFKVFIMMNQKGD